MYQRFMSLIKCKYINFWSKANHSYSLSNCRLIKIKLLTYLWYRSIFFYVKRKINIKTISKAGSSDYIVYNLRNIHCLLKNQDYGNIMPRKLNNLFQKINWITSCFITNSSPLFIMQRKLNFFISWICLQLGGIHCLVNKSVNLISVIAKDEICVEYWNPKQQVIYRIKDFFLQKGQKYALITLKVSSVLFEVKQGRLYQRPRRKLK